MPLNRRGRKLKRAMQKTYGRTKGAKVFYAYENKHKDAVRRSGERRR